MRKIFLYSFIVTLLALVVFVSGCTQNNNQTNQNNTGTYAVNGLSFEYPADWVISSQTRGNFQIISMGDQAFIESNNTRGDLVTIEATPKSENVSFEKVKNELTNGTNVGFNTTNSTVNIAGLVGNVTTFTENSTGNQTQIKLIYFEKNNFAYILRFIVTGGVNAQDQQKFFDIIINSFKVP